MIFYFKFPKEGETPTRWRPNDLSLDRFRFSEDSSLAKVVRVLQDLADAITANDWSMAHARKVLAEVAWNRLKDKIAATASWGEAIKVILRRHAKYEDISRYDFETIGNMVQKEREDAVDYARRAYRAMGSVRGRADREGLTEVAERTAPGLVGPPRQRHPSGENSSRLTGPCPGTSAWRSWMQRAEDGWTCT